MSNSVALINMLLSYLLVFGIAVVLVVIGVMVGIRLRKRKDAKETLILEQQKEI